MLSINTNLSSLIAQQSMKTSTNKLNLAIERMTTGFKINHAKDNAANYSISTNMTTKINSYMVAEDNVAMGLDMLATANGSLDQISDKLTRLRDLATQASNGTYGAQSLNAINQEANALVDEIERIYNNSEYNGIDLMKGKVTGTEQSKFIKDIDRRDTSKMTKLSSVDPTEKLELGTYSISTAEELAQLATMTNNGLIGANTEFVLANDIDLSGYQSGEGWVPIGIEENPFGANFDGNGYEISNLLINREQRYQGLFGMTIGATLNNVYLSNVDIFSSSYAGALTGSAYNETSINNCYSEGVITIINSFGGGLVGHLHLDSVINDSYSMCNVENQISAEGYVGGLVGVVQASSTITNCFAVSGDLRSNGLVGGLVGVLMDSNISHSYSDNSIATNRSGGGFIGAVCGSNIFDCYTSSLVSEEADAVATGAFIGFVGWIDNNTATTIDNCSVLSYSSDVDGIWGGYQSGARLERISVKNSRYTDEYDTNGITNFPLSYEVSKYNIENVQAVANIAKPFVISNDSNVVSHDSSLQLQVGTNSDSNSRISIDTGFVIDGISSLRGIGMNDLDYLSYIDKFLNNLSNRTTDIGAVENRLESALDEISIQYENLVSSRSTIRDADIAEVSSEYIRQQILQQASATLLATANQSPSIALQLI